MIYFSLSNYIIIIINMTIKMTFIEELSEIKYTYIIQICDFLNIDEYYVTYKKYDDYIVYYSILKMNNSWYFHYIVKYDDDYTSISIKKIDTSNINIFENSDIAMIETPIEEHINEYCEKYDDIYIKYYHIEYDWGKNEVNFHIKQKYIFENVNSLTKFDFINKLRAIYYIT